MDLKWRILLVIILAVLALVVFLRIFKDYRMQKKLISLRKARKARGTFSIQAYADNKKHIKEKIWAKQKNKGIHPCDLNKEINLRDYSDGIPHIVKKAGM